MLKLIAATILLIAFYVLWWSVSFAELHWALLAALLLAVSAGLYLGKRWGAYLWFGLAVGTTLWWFAVLARVVESGWPYQGFTDSAISLLPGLFLLGLCVAGSVLVYRRIIRGNNAP